jgi:anti-anti-sigma factor
MRLHALSNVIGEPEAPQNSVRVDVFYESVVVSGELDLWSSQAMVNAVLELAGPGPSAVDLDLSEVTFMDSAGLQALVELTAALSTMRIVAVSPQVLHVLAMTDMTDIVSIHVWERAGREAT